MKIYAELIRTEYKYKKYRIKSLYDNKIVHIHVGYKNPTIDKSLLLIKYMDMYLGIPSVIEDPDTKRRSLYGKAGAFRLTGYGLEYRVLSSAMMRDTITLKKVWRGIVKSIEAFNHGMNTISKSYVIEAINKSDKDLAIKLIDKYNLV